MKADQLLKKSVDINVMYLELSLKQIPDADLAVGGGTLPNSPAWQAGHLLSAIRYGVKLLGGEASASAAWADKCPRGGPAPMNRSDYPSGQQIIDDCKQASYQLLSRLSEASDAQLLGPTPDENTRKMFPTVADIAVFVLTTHAAHHVGQLAAWRRAKGMPQVIG